MTLDAMHESERPAERLRKSKSRSILESFSLKRFELKRSKRARETDEANVPFSGPASLTSIEPIGSPSNSTRGTHVSYTATPVESAASSPPTLISRLPPSSVSSLGPSNPPSPPAAGHHELLNDHDTGRPVNVARPSLEEWERDRHLGLDIQQRAQRELIRQVASAMSSKSAAECPVDSSSSDSLPTPVAISYTASVTTLLSGAASSVQVPSGSVSPSSSKVPRQAASSLRAKSSFMRRSRSPEKIATTPTVAPSSSPSLFNLSLRAPSKSTATLVSSTLVAPDTTGAGRMASFLRPLGRSKTKAARQSLGTEAASTTSPEDLMESWEVVEPSAYLLDPALDEQLPLPPYPPADACAILSVQSSTGTIRKVLIPADPSNIGRSTGSSADLLSRFPSPPSGIVAPVHPSLSPTSDIPSSLSAPSGCESSAGDSEPTHRRRPPPPPPPRRRRPAKSASVTALHVPRPTPFDTSVGVNARMSLPPPPRYCSTYAEPQQPAVPFPRSASTIVEETTEVSSVDSIHPFSSPASSRTSLPSQDGTPVVTTDGESVEECPSDDDGVTPSVWQTPLTSPLVSRRSYAIGSDSDDEDEWLSANEDDASGHRVPTVASHYHTKAKGHAPASATAARYAADPYTAWRSPLASWVGPEEWQAASPPLSPHGRLPERIRTAMPNVTSDSKPASPSITTSHQQYHHHPHAMCPCVSTHPSPPGAYTPATPICSHMMPPFYFGFPPYFLPPSGTGSMPFYMPYSLVHPAAQSTLYPSHSMQPYIGPPAALGTHLQPLPQVHDFYAAATTSSERSPLRSGPPPSVPALPLKLHTAMLSAAHSSTAWIPLFGGKSSTASPFLESQQSSDTFSVDAASFLPSALPLSSSAQRGQSAADRPLPTPPRTVSSPLVHVATSMPEAPTEYFGDVTPVSPRTPRSPARPEGPRPRKTP